MKRHLNCPRCSVALKTMLVNNKSAAIEIDVCEKCEGVWFDEGELEQVEYFVDSGFVKSPNVLPSMRVQLQGIKCPVCRPRAIMRKSVHPKDPQVIVDTCHECNGIWLDGGELGAIQSASSVRAGR